MTDVAQRRTSFRDRLRSAAVDEALTSFPGAAQAGPVQPPVRERRTRRFASPGVLTAVLVTLARYTAQWELSLGNLTVTLDPQDDFAAATVTAALPVTLLLGPAGARVQIEVTEDSVTVEHDPARHEPEVMAGFLRHVEALLYAARAAPETPVAELPILDENDLAATVDRPNRTDRPRRPGTLVDAFAHAVAQHGDRPALGDWRETITYDTLADRAYGLAHELSLRREDRVAILVTRGDLRWVVACLAVLHAGGAWLPLDPDTPRQRIGTLLREADVRAVITDSLLSGQIPEGSWQVLDLDTRVDEGPRKPPAVSVEPTDLAYAIYTSGSTGTPRAVLVEHDSVLNFTETMQRLMALRPEDRLIQFASPAFDVSVFEIFSALLTGAFLRIADDNERLSVEGLSRVLEKERITVAELPPVLLEMMDPARFPDLRLVSVGGEPFSGALATRWSVGRRFINGYGPTEATVAVTFKECQGEWRSTPPIGRPGDNQRAYVLDDHLRPVPVGAIGELCLAGAGLARGYLGQPEITADRFRQNPFGPGRLYRTGDLVRRAPDGDLVFVARRDRQVKVRGQRVELGEIESVLLSGPEVRGAVVTVEAGALTAYVVGPVEELRGFLTERLPAYMVPGRLVEIAEIPVTRNGKVDLTALAAPMVSATNGDPLTVLEQRLVDRCYATALPGVTVAPDADFFALGGTSLQAIRLMSLVRKLVGAEIPLAEFFRRPTLRALAGAIEGSTP